MAIKTRTEGTCIDMKSAENRKCASCSSGEHDFENAIFEPSSVGHSFFAFGSASAERNENHKNQLGACFGSAGRNAQVRWGDFWGVCDLQIEIGILIFALWV